MKITYCDKLFSTNDTVKELNEDNSLVYAGEQTKGRGQRGNSWESQDGMNLTLSLLIRPSFIPADKQFNISMMVSVSVVKLLNRYGLDAKIKWPNDIYVRDKKICGILIESDISSSGVICRCVIGIGLNINQRIFVSDAPNPTSISLETDAGYDVKEVLDTFVLIFEQEYKALQNCDIDEEYLSLMYQRNEIAKYKDKDGLFFGTIVGIGEYGMLHIIKEGGEDILYQFKEVVYL